MVQCLGYHLNTTPDVSHHNIFENSSLPEGSASKHSFSMSKSNEDNC